MDNQDSTTRFSQQKEKWCNKYFRVLDKGFVALKDVMGSDEDIEAAARVSYQKGTRKKSDTRNLLRYCMSHLHTSIFEQVVFKWHVKAPILNFRQWHRHRNWSYNEVSGRYSILPDECLETSSDKWRLQSGTNKQGSSGYIEEWPEDDNHDRLCAELCGAPSYKNGPGTYLSWREQGLQEQIREVYEERIALGVAREQARKDLPVSQYSEMYATVNLHNLFHFMGLRSDSHAQEEIRLYSNVMAGIVKEVCPLAFEAWYDYRYCGSGLSKLDRKFFQYLLGRYGRYGFESVQELRDKHEGSGDKYPNNILEMSQREIDGFWSKLDVPSEMDFTLDINKAEPFEAFVLD